MSVIQGHLKGVAVGRQAGPRDQPDHPRGRFQHAQRPVSYPAVGLGEELRLSGLGLSGAALVVDGRILHLVALGNERQPSEPPIYRSAP